MFYTYILKSTAHTKIYIGQTSNLERRIWAHENGLSPWSKKWGPWVLVHSEEFVTRSEAMAREKFLKTGTGRDWIKNNITNAEM